MQTRGEQYVRVIETLSILIKSRLILHRSEFELPEQNIFHLIIVIQGLGL